MQRLAAYSPNSANVGSLKAMKEELNLENEQPFEFRWSRTLGRIATAFVRDLPALIAVSALGWAPLAFLVAPTVARMAVFEWWPEDFTTILLLASQGSPLTRGLLIAGSVVAHLVSWALCVHLVWARLVGEKLRLPTLLRRALRDLWPLVRLSVVAGVMIYIGFLLCFLPGLLLVCGFFLVVPALLIERSTAGAACQRSLELTRGHGAGMIVFLLAMTSAGVAAETWGVSWLPSEASDGWELLVLTLVDWWLGLLAVVASTVLYHDLRYEIAGPVPAAHLEMVEPG